MIATIDCKDKKTFAAVVGTCWTHGIEHLPLVNYQLEIWSADDRRLDSILNKYPVTILHKEATKIVTGEEIQMQTYTDGWNDGYRHAVTDLLEKIQEQIDIAWANDEEDQAQTMESLYEFLDTDN